MEMWSVHLGDYEMLMVFGCVTYSHIKQCNLEPRAVKYVFLGYPQGVKGYMLYRLNNESPNIVTSRIAIFNKSVMYKGTLKDSGAGTDKSVEELQVKVELWGLNNRTLEKDLKIIASEDSPKWKSNMKEEMDSMRKNKTSELLDYPAEQTLESYKWLFKIKE
nr:hypothetical protein [Tanacetum cinerariifolium]